MMTPRTIKMVAIAIADTESDVIKLGPIFSPYFGANTKVFTASIAA